MGNCRATARYSLLEFRIDAGDEILKNHHATCRATAEYSSKTIQNQFIALMGDHIRDSLIKEVKYFSILCEPLSQGSLTDSKIREEFLDFQSTERITGEVITQLILGKLEQWGLDISHYRGQDYDSASNMSSQPRGI